MRGIVDQSHGGQPGPARLITVHDQEDDYTSRRRGSISRTLQKPEDAFSWSMAGLGGLRSVCILTLNTDSGESHHSANLCPCLRVSRGVFSAASGLCNIKRQFSRGLSLRTCGRVYFGIVGPSLWLSLHPERLMDRLLRKKSKKSPKYSQRGQGILPGISVATNVAGLGLPPQLKIAPKGEKKLFLPDLDAD